jgi:hypothetical protein
MEPEAGKLVTFKTLMAALSGGVIPVLKELKGRHEARMGAIEARLAALEEKPSVRYCGVWEAGKDYMNGDAVTKGGSLWICKLNHVSSEPGVDYVSWQLAVKRGRDGKDAR